MRVTFTKAQAIGNDFILVEESVLRHAGIGEESYCDFSRKICDRDSGVGADGVEILLENSFSEKFDYAVRMFNPDGSEAEISGNGTRCIAAMLMASKRVSESLRISTKAGVSVLKLVERDGHQYNLQMSMESPRYKSDEIGCRLQTASGDKVVTIVDVGNPQCVLLVNDFDCEWRAIGSEIETHTRFPARTNVSFARSIDRHTIEVRFWERGAGETASSGTGSIGAAVGAILAGLCDSPVRVMTTAGDLQIQWENGIVLTGRAELAFQGEYLYS
jgi:diaminopimelate epimerase